jgi:hypothetical protein
LSFLTIHLVLPYKTFKREDHRVRWSLGVFDVLGDRRASSGDCSGRTNFEKLAIVRLVKEKLLGRSELLLLTVPKIVPILARLGANQRESVLRKLLVRLVTDLVE